MASHTILLGFGVVFWCLQLLQPGNIPPPRGGVEGLVAADLVIPAIVTTFGLTLLLLYAHVLVLGRADAATGGPGNWHRSVARLAKATLASAALLAGAVALRLVAGDGRLGGADDVGWFSTT